MLYFHIIVLELPFLKNLFVESIGERSVYNFLICFMNLVEAPIDQNLFHIKHIMLLPLLDYCYGCIEIYFTIVSTFECKQIDRMRSIFGVVYGIVSILI